MGRSFNYGLVAILALLTACNSPMSLFPGPLFASNFPPPGPPNYQQGMNDGCATALTAIGTSTYGTDYNHVHYDVDKALNDPVYYKAWKDAYFYCKYEHDKGPE